MDAYQCDVCKKYFLYQPITKTAYTDCGNSEKGKIIAFIDFGTKQDLCPACRKEAVKVYVDKILHQLKNGEKLKEK